MPSTNSTDLIKQPGISSGGALKDVCIMQWNHEQSIDAPVRWFQGEFRFQGDFRMPKTEYTNEELNVLLIRALCHFIIDWLPPKGVFDAYDCLSDSYEFYSLPPAPQRRISEGPSIDGVFETVAARPVRIVDED